MFSVFTSGYVNTENILHFFIRGKFGFSKPDVIIFQ